MPPSASWLSVSPTSGVQAGVLTLTFRTSGLGAGVYQTAFDVVENDSGVRARVSVQVTMVGSSVPSPVLAGRHALRNMSSKQDRAVVERFRGGGDLQCDH